MSKLDSKCVRSLECAGHCMINDEAGEAARGSTYWMSDYWMISRHRFGEASAIVSFTIQTSSFVWATTLYSSHMHTLSLAMRVPK